jgi:hypothetical protein
MKRTIVLVLAGLAAAAPLAVTSADAQVPPRYGPYGDKDRDGVPNAYDRHDNRYGYNRYGAWGDRDRDGVPNAYDRFDNRGLRDKDRDGVPQAWDRNDRNPWRN